jgi:DNA repair protein RadC
VEELDLEALLERVAGPVGGPVGRVDGVWRGRGLAELARFEPCALVQELGLERRRAERLAAAFELGRRVEQAALPVRPSLTSADRVQALLAPLLRGLERETFVLLLLDGKHRLRRREVVSIGTLTSSLVHPREVFRCAVREAAAAIVCAHNHPSGDPEPSPEDLEVTRRLIESGRLLGIPLLDHVILGGGRHVSLRERMGFGAAG